MLEVDIKPGLGYFLQKMVSQFERQLGTMFHKCHYKQLRSHTYMVCLWLIYSAVGIILVCETPPLEEVSTASTGVKVQ